MAIKDNIAVANVPMMNGTVVLEGFTPSYDASVVTRILDAGTVGSGSLIFRPQRVPGGQVTYVQVLIGVSVPLSGTLILGLELGICAM